jgi:hypothetical protein
MPMLNSSWFMENPSAILHVDKNPGDDRARRQLCSPSTQYLPFGGLQVEHKWGHFLPSRIKNRIA